MLEESVKNRINSYRDLLVWQKSKSFAVDIYKTTENFPKSEEYGLKSQLRRAGISMPSNVAEGYRRGTKEFIQFLKISFGSGAEVETQLEIALALGYLTEKQVQDLMLKLEEIMRMQNSLIRKLSNKSSK